MVRHCWCPLCTCVNTPTALSAHARSIHGACVYACRRARNGWHDADMDTPTYRPLAPSTAAFPALASFLPDCRILTQLHTSHKQQPSSNIRTGRKRRGSNFADDGMNTVGFKSALLRTA